MSLSEGDIEVIREIVRGELSGIKKEMNDFRGELSGIKKEMNDFRGELSGIKKEMNDFRGELSGIKVKLNKIDELEIRLNRIKKSRGGLIIAPRVSHVHSLGNSMDRSDIEEIPNSAYKYR